MNLEKYESKLSKIKNIHKLLEDGRDNWQKIRDSGPNQAVKTWLLPRSYGKIRVRSPDLQRVASSRDFLNAQLPINTV